MSAVPYTRTLAYVLRDQLGRGTGLRLFIAPVAAIPDPGHVTIDQGGAQVTIARSKSYTPAVGDAAICISAGATIIAIDAIAATGSED